MERVVFHSFLSQPLPHLSNWAGWLPTWTATRAGARGESRIGLSTSTIDIPHDRSGRGLPAPASSFLIGGFHAFPESRFAKGCVHAHRVAGGDCDHRHP